jgi:hypothetical protein
MVSHGAVKYLLQFLNDADISDPRADFLREILDLHLMQIESVTDTGRDEQVWDIEVPGDHEYQSGALLSHNCERSSDIVTATWVDDELRSNNQVRFMCLKSRDDAPFEAFYAHVDWPQRRISTLKDPNIRDAHKKGNEIDKMEDDILSDLV